MALLIGLGAGAGAWGQTAYLVADLAPGLQARAASNPSSLIAAGRHVFFLTSPEIDSQASPDEGSGFWVTDGTAGGTRQLPLPAPCRSCAGPPFNFTAAGNLLFYTSDVGELELWRSDGTTAGTFRVSSDIGGDAAYQQFATLGGVLYFTTYALVSTPNHYAKQLWRSDGTVAGTALVADLGESPFPVPADFLVAVGGKVFFPGPQRPRPASWTSGRATARRRARRRCEDSPAPASELSPRCQSAAGSSSSAPSAARANLSG